jgi:AraC-like DNA-binding protein
MDCARLDLLAAPQDIPILAPLIQREILYRLLVGEQGARLRQMASAGSQSQQIAQAIEWLKHHYPRPLRIEALAAQAHMSPSTFHQHCRALTAMGPLQYQKWLRLNEARRLMLAERLDAATAAFQHATLEAETGFAPQTRQDGSGQAPYADLDDIAVADQPRDMAAHGSNAMGDIATFQGDRETLPLQRKIDPLTGDRQAAGRRRHRMIDLDHDQTRLVQDRRLEINADAEAAKARGIRRADLDHGDIDGRRVHQIVVNGTVMQGEEPHPPLGISLLKRAVHEKPGEPHFWIEAGRVVLIDSGQETANIVHAFAGSG